MYGEEVLSLLMQERNQEQSTDLQRFICRLGSEATIRLSNLAFYLIQTIESHQLNSVFILRTAPENEIQCINIL